jgi:hypothetical protein
MSMYRAFLALRTLATNAAAITVRALHYDKHTKVRISHCTACH